MGAAFVAARTDESVIRDRRSLRRDGVTVAGESESSVGADVRYTRVARVRVPYCRRGRGRAARSTACLIGNVKGVRDGFCTE